MVHGDKVAIVGCSNGQKAEAREKINALQRKLCGMGLVPVMGKYIFERDSIFSGAGRERAESLMAFYSDREIRAIFDISGGDVANGVLPYLDFDKIAESDKKFWGYSDLTTIINAIYAKTGKESVWYQIRNLVSDDGDSQLMRFRNTVLGGRQDLFDFRYSFVQKEEMEGIVVGGTIRCLLKLAGTEYWPNMDGKILFLEANGGTVPQMATYLSQLKQMGVFECISGILLGTFLTMEAEACVPDMVSLVKACAGPNIPIAVTEEIGHKTNSKAIVIGREMYLG